MRIFMVSKIFIVKLRLTTIVVYLQLAKNINESLYFRIAFQFIIMAICYSAPNTVNGFEGAIN